MTVRAFHPILYVADPHSERDFFSRFGFETAYEGDEFPGFLAVERGSVCFGLSGNRSCRRPGLTIARGGSSSSTMSMRLSRYAPSLNCPVKSSWKKVARRIVHVLPKLLRPTAS